MKCRYCKKAVRWLEKVMCDGEEVIHYKCRQNELKNGIFERYKGVLSDCVIESLLDKRLTDHLESAWVIITRRRQKYNDYSIMTFRNKHALANMIKEIHIYPSGYDYVVHRVLYKGKPIKCEVDISVNIKEKANGKIPTKRRLRHRCIQRR